MLVFTRENRGNPLNMQHKEEGEEEVVFTRENRRGNIGHPLNTQHAQRKRRQSLFVV